MIKVEFFLGGGRGCKYTIPSGSQDMFVRGEGYICVMATQTTLPYCTVLYNACAFFNQDFA